MTKIRKPKTFGQILAQELFSIGDMAIRETVDTADIALRTALNEKPSNNTTRKQSKYSRQRTLRTQFKR